MVLLAYLFPVPPILSAAPPWRGSGFFFSPPGGGGGEGGKSEIVPQSGKVASEKGQKQGRPRLCCVRWGCLGSGPEHHPAWASVRENKSKGAKEGATRARGRPRGGLFEGQGKWGAAPGTWGASWGWGDAATVSPPSLFHPPPQLRSWPYPLSSQ